MAAQLPRCSTSPSAAGTIKLLGLLVGVSLALVWANNTFVMTEEVLLALAGNPQDSFQVDVQLEMVRQMNVWGYVAAPIQTAFRIGFVALVIQLICLLAGVEIPYGRTFRIAATAFWATLFGSFLQVVWIAKQPASAITRASLGIVPDSLAAWLETSSNTPSLLYHALSHASVTSFMWMLLLYWGLRETERLRPAGASAVTATAWLTVSAFSVGTAMLARHLVS